jgi:hypothetical protein
MTLQLVKAQRSKAYLRLGIASPSGGGKTAGALLIAYGLLKEKYPSLSDGELWSKIALVDTENGSGSLYVGSNFGTTHVGEYNTVVLTSPFEVSKYINAIELCESAGMEVCILDSTSHAWGGEGGLLEQQGNITKRTGNSYTAWRDITPLHNRFVEKMLQTPMHVIATMRSKQEYVQEKTNDGKNVVRKLGLEPEQRKGMEYEFTVFLEIDAEHIALGAKDRTSMFDQKYFTITPDVGKKLMQWLESGVEKNPVVLASALEKTEKDDALKNIKQQIVDRCKQLGGSKNSKLMELLVQYAPNKNPNSISDESKLKELNAALDNMINMSDKSSDKTDKNSE